MGTAIVAVADVAAAIDCSYLWLLLLLNLNYELATKAHIAHMATENTWPSFPLHVKSCTLPETNIAPENRWLEYYFPIGFRPIFRCKSLVSGRVKMDLSPDFPRWIPSPLHFKAHLGGSVTVAVKHLRPRCFDTTSLYQVSTKKRGKRGPEIQWLSSYRIKIPSFPRLTLP